MKHWAVMQNDSDGADDYVIVEFYGTTHAMLKKDAVEFANDLRREAMPAVRSTNRGGNE